MLLYLPIPKCYTIERIYLGRGDGIESGHELRTDHTLVWASANLAEKENRRGSRGQIAKVQR